MLHDWFFFGPISKFIQPCHLIAEKVIIILVLQNMNQIIIILLVLNKILIQHLHYRAWTQGDYRAWTQVEYRARTQGVSRDWTQDVY